MIILTKKIAPFSSPTNMVNLRGSDELPTSGAIEAEGFSVDLIVGYHEQARPARHHYHNPKEYERLWRLRHLCSSLADGVFREF